MLDTLRKEMVPGQDGIKLKERRFNCYYKRENAETGTTGICLANSIG
jgi:hypothetical protein